MTPTDLLVCTRCHAEPVRAEPRAGAALHAALERLAVGEHGVTVASVPCLSACKRGCAIALMAPGKASYLFGDLDATAAGDVLAVALAHASRPDGFLPRATRPERLRAGILARLPAPPHRLALGAFAWPAA